MILSATAHRTRVLVADEWSIRAGQIRGICDDCNWRGRWHPIYEETAAHADADAHRGSPS